VISKEIIVVCNDNIRRTIDTLKSRMSAKDFIEYCKN
jgi:hypothetical protein